MIGDQGGAGRCRRVASRTIACLPDLAMIVHVIMAAGDAFRVVSQHSNEQMHGGDEDDDSQPCLSPRSLDGSSTRSAWSLVRPGRPDHPRRAALPHMVVSVQVGGAGEGVRVAHGTAARVTGPLAVVCIAVMGATREVHVDGSDDFDAFYLAIAARVVHQVYAVCGDLGEPRTPRRRRMRGRGRDGRACPATTIRRRGCGPSPGGWRPSAGAASGGGCRHGPGSAHSHPRSAPTTNGRKPMSTRIGKALAELEHDTSSLRLARRRRSGPGAGRGVGIGPPAVLPRPSPGRSRPRSSGLRRSVAGVRPRPCRPG